MEPEKVVISVRADRRGGALVGYGVQAIEAGVEDRIEGYLEAITGCEVSPGDWGAHIAAA